MMLCFDRRYLAARGVPAEAITGWVHDSGQPTDHFKVLEYAGLDRRRVIIDERAPIYFVGLEEAYSPMLILAADSDRKNRYEQNMLLLKTLEHFHYDPEKIRFRLMHGKHCAHVSAVDENGDSVFGKIIFEFLSEQP